MAVRPNARSLRGRNDQVAIIDTPGIPGSLAFGESLARVGQQFLQAAQVTLGPIRDAVAQDQRKKGLIAASTATTTLPSGQVIPTQPELREGVTLAEQSFNSAVREATDARFTTSIIETTAELRRQFPDNPQGFRDAFRNYLQALTNGLPEEDRLKYELIGARNMLPSEQRIFERKIEIERDAQTTAINDDILALEGEAALQAENLFSDNPELAGRSAEALDQIALQLGQRYNATDLQGRRLYDPKTRDDAVRRFVSDAVVVASRAGLRKTDNKLTYITTLEERFRALGLKLSEEQFQTIEDALYADLNQEIAIEETLASSEASKLDRFQLDNFEGMSQRIGQGLTRAEVESDFEDGTISLQQRNTLLAAVENPAQVTDTGAFLQLRNAADGDPADFQALYRQLSQRLEPNDQRVIMERAFDFQAGGGFLQLELVKRAYKELRTIYNDTGIISSLTGTAGAELASATRGFDDAVLSGESPEQAIQLAREYVDRERKQRLGDSPVRDLQKQGNSGIISKPDGSGVDVDISTKNLLEDLSRPGANLDAIEKQLDAIEQSIGP